MNRQIQLNAANCIECVKSGKKLKSLIPDRDVTKKNLLKTESSAAVRILSPLPPVLGAKEIFARLHRYIFELPTDSP